MPSRLSALIAFATLLLFAPLTAAQRAADGYDALLANAVTAFDAGKYVEARELFSRAHQLRPNARTLRGMGLAAYEAGRYAVSLTDLRQALAETQKPMNDAQRVEVERIVADAEAHTAHYRLMGQPPGAVIRVNGEPPLWDAAGFLMLDAGTHELQLTRADGTTRTWTLQAQGEQWVDFDLDPPASTSRPPRPTPERNPWKPIAAAPRAPVLSEPAPLPEPPKRDDRPAVLAYVALGAAAAAAGVSVWQWRERESEISAWNSGACLSGGRSRRENCAGHEDAYERAELIGWISAGAAITFAAGGLALLALDGGESAESASDRCIAGAASIHCRVSF